jgi:MFS family permease
VQQTTAASLLTVGCFMSFFIFGGYGLGMGYPAEFFPAKIRATSYGVTSFFARIASGLSPFLIGFISDRFSLAAGLPILSGVFIVCAILIYIMAPETAKEEIDQDADASIPTVGSGHTISQ